MSASSRSVAPRAASVIDTGSRTDWERVRQNIADDAPIPYDPEDGPYDPNDEAAVDAYWDAAIITQGLGKRGPQKAPPKQLVSLRISREVLEHFRATGPGWQTRIDETLKKATRAKRSSTPASKGKS
jgi:uncharacterized protein (DUF4415 family)